MIEQPGTETLAIGTSPSKATTAKVGQDLLALYAEYQAHLKDTSGQRAAAPAFKSSNAIAPVAGGSVVIDATASGDAEALATDLRALGAENVTAFGRMVSGRLAIIAIPALQDLASLQFARPAYAATTGRGNESGGPRDARGHPWSPGRCSAWRASTRRAIHNLKCLSRHSAVK